jgi:hypothetical protein
MIRMKSRYDRPNQESSSALGASQLKFRKEKAMRRRKSSGFEVSLENSCSVNQIAKGASTSPKPVAPRRSQEILRFFRTCRF